MPFTTPYTLKPVRTPAPLVISKGDSIDLDALKSSWKTTQRGSFDSATRSRDQGDSGDIAPGGGLGQQNAEKGKEEAGPPSAVPKLAKNSATSAATDGSGASESKDVEKERHYNAFMEDRLKLGRTRTVAEPLMKLKAAAQQPPAATLIGRRGSAPIYWQAMLRRPSERRLSSPKAKVEKSEIENVTTATDVNREVATPGVAARKSRSSPGAPSPRSSPAKTASAGSTMSSTVVTTLTDLGQRDEVRKRTPAVAAAPTLRITKKPSVKKETAPGAATTQTPKDVGGLTCAGNQDVKRVTEEKPVVEIKRTTPPKKTTTEEKAAVEGRRTTPPKKTPTVSVPVRKRSQPLRIRTSVSVEETVNAERKPKATTDVGDSKKVSTDSGKVPEKKAVNAHVDVGLGKTASKGDTTHAVPVEVASKSSAPKEDNVSPQVSVPEPRVTKEEHRIEKPTDKMQTVDIKDLRVLLRTPSPHPPKGKTRSVGDTVDVPRKGSLASLGKSSEILEDEASTSGVSSQGSVRRDSGSSRPNSLSWDSDVALSTATSTPSDAVSALRSRSVSVESAVDQEDGPKSWAANVNARPMPSSLGGPRRSSAGGRSSRSYVTSTGKPWWTTTVGTSTSQVGDLWADLGQEQASSAQAAEMLEAETAERLRLDKEVRDLQARCSQLQQQKDRLEMEAMESRMLRSADLNGDLSDDDDVKGSSVYKQKYERTLREAEMARRKMSQQHEDDLEKHLMARKATEKRLAEALDDLEEGRQAVNQWKRKAQKLAAELQDLKLLVEEHMARNAELERKQRKFDGELSSAADNLKQEKAAREKVQREKEALYSEKHSLEQELAAVRSELDSQHDKLASLRRELEELSFSSHGEEEVAKLKRSRQELERKSRDQEEELEDLAGQVQLLEQAKLRLEMSLEKQRQEQRRELSQRDEEQEEARAQASKRLRHLEALLEGEQEERQALARQRQDLERRLAELSERPPPRDPQVERRLRRDLRRTRALLQDAQAMLEGARDGQAARALLRQLKNQLEDAEFAKTAAIKARQGAELELQEVQSQLEEVLRAKNESEGRCIQMTREKSALQMQLEEMEEEQAELMKKYRSAVQQMASDQKVLSEQTQQIMDLESEKHHLKEQVHDLSSKMDHLSSQAEDSHAVRRLEARVRDLESKLELEQTSKARLESQVARVKEQCGRLQEETDQAGLREQQAQEGWRKLQRQIRELREDCAQLQHREAQAHQRCHELEMSLENAETDLQGTKQDLKLACQRIQDLQAALEEDLDSGTDVADESDSDSDNDLDLDGLLRRHGLAGSKMAGGVGDSSPITSRRSSSSVGLSFSRTRVPSLGCPL